MIWLNDHLFYAMKTLKEEVRRHPGARRAARPATTTRLQARTAWKGPRPEASGLCQPGRCAGGA